ncbi:MAG TPA: hypothetical protein VJ654_08400 [Noviherbaspirillum sp.]|nr:hypothetical protein [Noviherbaspirillum sp.]
MWNWLKKILGSPKRKYLRWSKKKVMKAPSIEDRFTWIYQHNFWNNSESVSGSGSTLAFTKNLRSKLPILFAEYDIKTVFDAPCGDFNWMRDVVSRTNIKYLGGDIVLPLVNENNKRYQDERTSFILFDITKDNFPDVDLLICRDCLFHLSYSDIEKFINGLQKSKIKYVLTSSHINTGFENKDILSGDFRNIDLVRFPFDFPEPLQAIDDWIHPHQPRFMGLWRREDLIPFMKEVTA